MAHQAHNISYSKYQKLMQYRLDEIQNGSNHNLNPTLTKDIDFLKNEFIANMIEFAISLKQKIKISDSYTPDEYEKIMIEYIMQLNQLNNNKLNHINFMSFDEMERVSKLCLDIHEKQIEEQLFVTILNGDIKLIKTFITALYTKTKYYKPSSFIKSHRYGQYWVGGLAESLHSFINSYLLLNTYFSYEDKLKNTIIKFKNITNYTFYDAFSQGCNLLNEHVISLFRMHVEKINYYEDYIDKNSKDFWNKQKHNKYILIFCNMDQSHIQDLLKEMFRIMYFSVAMMIYDSDDVTCGIEEIKYAYERCVHF